MRETIVCLSTEGRLHVYNIPKMLQYTLDNLKNRLKRGEDLSGVQNMLELIERVPFNLKVKPTQFSKTQPFEQLVD